MSDWTTHFEALPPQHANSKGQLVPARQGATLIAALVDRSGSMAMCLAPMETGLNDFVRDQAGLPGGAAITLAQFDTVYELVWPMQDIAGAPRYKLQPRGQTAMLDAIGEFITEIADQLGDDTEWRKVVCVIVTDGAENASKEWTRDAITDLIAYWRDSYQWEFVFLGANIDAVATAESFGIPKDSALTFDVKHTKASCALLTKHVGTLRAGRPAGFTEQDRRKALGQ
jgi:hypothetical protein